MAASVIRNSVNPLSEIGAARSNKIGAISDVCNIVSIWLRFVTLSAVHPNQLLATFDPAKYNKQISALTVIETIAVFLVFVHLRSTNVDECNLGNSFPRIFGKAPLITAVVGLSRQR